MISRRRVKTAREFLCDGPPLLAQHVGTPVVRYVDLKGPPSTLRVQPPLHLLGMVCSPRDDELALLDVETEQATLESRLGPLVDEDWVTIRWLAAATLPALQQDVDHGADFHVFHPIGTARTTRIRAARA